MGRASSAVRATWSLEKQKADKDYYLAAKRRYEARIHEQSPIVSCACGCGETFHSISKWGIKQEFVHNHKARLGFVSDNDFRYGSDALRSQRKRDARERVIQLMGGKCVDCGHEYNGNNQHSFDIHHLDRSKKSFQLGGTALISKTWAEVEEELSKCILLCCECHRRKHYKTTVNNKKDLRAEAIIKKGSRCNKCGKEVKDGEGFIFDFHHRNPEEKAFSIAHRQLRARSWEECQREIDKCDLLCVKCHRDTHHLLRECNE